MTTDRVESRLLRRMAGFDIVLVGGPERGTGKSVETGWAMMDWLRSHPGEHAALIGPNYAITDTFRRKFLDHFREHFTKIHMLEAVARNDAVAHFCSANLIDGLAGVRLGAIFVDALEQFSLERLVSLYRLVSRQQSPVLANLTLRSPESLPAMFEFFGNCSMEVVKL